MTTLVDPERANTGLVLVTCTPLTPEQLSNQAFPTPQSHFICEWLPVVITKDLLLDASPFEHTRLFCHECIPVTSQPSSFKDTAEFITQLSPITRVNNAQSSPTTAYREALDDVPPSQGPTLVPPSSQSHFAKFKNFTPKNDAGFEDEFAHLASSQNWVPGSQQFKKEGTIAMRQELITHFFSSQPTPSQTQTQTLAQSKAASRTPTQAQAIRTQSQATKTQSQTRTQTKTQTVTPTQTDDDVSDYSDGILDDDDYESVLITATQQTCWSSQPAWTEEPVELTPEQELQGFQDLCSEVGIPRGATIPQCKRALKSKLVNIIDLIDTRRTGKKVKIWTDFEAFKAYTLHPDHRIDREEAKAGPGYLAALLQGFRQPNGQRIGGNRYRPGGNRTAGGFKHDKTRSGRVEKGYLKGNIFADLRPDADFWRQV